MPHDRRTFLAFSTAALAAPRAACAQPSGAVFRPEDFGARGDGVTNDTAAFAAVSERINRSSGGTITLGAGKTYIVGAQNPGGQFGWTPEPIVELRGLRQPARIIGNGARLRCQPGLRYGTFDRATGRPVHRPMPNLRIEEVASPYRAMIFIHDCKAPVEIRDIELDGNLERLELGGPYGDTGWQIPAFGIWLQDNMATETVANVLSHHQGQDGAYVAGEVRRAARSRFSHFIARYNGRQGLSLTGGRGYDFVDCEFSLTGKSVIASAPGAGVDIEAEGGRINRDCTFTRCKFLGNTGAGMVADSGDSEGARFADCLFVGDKTWSAWPRKPGFRFEGCTFVGAVVHAFPDPDPERAARFIGCRFTDDPALSPNGKVFEGDPDLGPDGGPIVNLGQSDNVLFDGCRFDLVGRAVLPWSWRAIYRDCSMSQVSSVTAMTKGKYLGRTTIRGPVDLYGSMILGTVMLNGKAVPRGPVGVEPW